LTDGDRHRADGYEALELVIGGRKLRFPAVWLRDNCPCAQCVDPGSGQKFHDITDIPDELVITATEHADDLVEVIYAPCQYLDQRADRIRALDAVLRWGFVLLHEVPAEPGMVIEVAASFGFVRETNYGALFDVRVQPAPGNLACTSRAILPHTDNPYRDPVPTVQLLHCLSTADDGGDTGLVDGFAAAAALRARDAESFDVLTGTAVPFGYIDKETELRASQPLIQLSPRGRIRGVRFNNRSARPLRLPYAEVTAFYPAYRRWAELLAQPERQLNLRLAPGDCLVFDNTRVLHARTAFSLIPGSPGSPGSPGRHLQGCYADLDGLASTLAVLRRPGNHELKEES
jgi:gamma-butyrobetaine dioxygenase